MFLKLGIIDLNVGNLKSIFCILQKIPLDFKIVLIKNNNDISISDKIILPGQGCILNYLYYLKNSDIYDSFINFCKFKKIMGICVGKHIFFKNSEEDGKVNCLFIFNGFIKKFFFKKNFLFKIPNIGWRSVKLINNHFLTKNIIDLKSFYFSHSYYLTSVNLDNVYGISNYSRNFSSIYIKNNIFLVQFHPEKSSFFGLNFFYNFSVWK